jgi:hypothetical protein
MYFINLWYTYIAGLQPARLALCSRQSTANLGKCVRVGCLTVYVRVPRPGHPAATPARSHPAATPQPSARPCSGFRHGADSSWQQAERDGTVSSSSQLDGASGSALFWSCYHPLTYPPADGCGYRRPVSCAIYYRVQACVLCRCCLFILTLTCESIRPLKQRAKKKENICTFENMRLEPGRAAG